MGQASLRKLDGSVVNPSLATVQSAVAGYLATEPNPTFSSIVLSTSPNLSRLPHHHRA